MAAIVHRIGRALDRCQPSAHWTPEGHWLLINWRAVGVVVDVALVPDGPAPAAPAGEARAA